MTVAAFMDAALYDPEDGYYARAVQRSDARAIFSPASTSARCSAS
jgi:SAM-dependent MidA family methyltransferase